MARPWLSLLLLLSLALVVIEADVSANLENCPGNTVCLLFVNDTCTINNKEATEHDYILRPGTSLEFKCENGYRKYLAGLEIKPLRLDKWNFSVTTWNDQRIESISFDFGVRSKISFPHSTTMELEWGKLHNSSFHALSFNGCFNLSTTNFCRYSFTIQAISEKLIDLMGKFDIYYWSSERRLSLILTKKFARLLNLLLHKLSPCTQSKINQVCYDTCDQITESNATLYCPSKLWYHSTAKDRFVRRWKESDYIICHKGIWTLDWPIIDPSFEWQCSKREPAKVTTFAFCVAMSFTLMIILLCVIVTYAAFVRRRVKNCPKVETTKRVKKRWSRIPERRHEMDSVAVYDSDWLILEFAGSGDGRFIFVLEHQRITTIGSNHRWINDQNNVEDNVSVTFDIDVIDMFLSRKTTIHGIGDLYGFGKCCGFYALDERTVVIVEYHAIDGIIRQRLVNIDLKRATAECTIYRTYATRFIDLGLNLETIRTAIVASHNDEAYLYPIDPLSAMVHKNISLLIIQVDAYVSQFWVQAAINDAFPILYSPFIMPDAKLGFFLTRSRNDDNVLHLSNIVVLDLNTGSVNLQDTFPKHLPRWTEDKAFKYLDWKQASSKEIVFFARFKNADIYATFNMHTFHWNTFEVEKGKLQPHIIPCADGSSFVLANLVADIGDCRVIWGDDKSMTKILRYRLIRHPTSVPSLAHLASIALQRSEILATNELEIIAKRFV